jgi:hypothetical protein
MLSGMTRRTFLVVLGMVLGRVPYRNRLGITDPGIPRRLSWDDEWSFKTTREFEILFNGRVVCGPAGNDSFIYAYDCDEGWIKDRNVNPDGVFGLPGEVHFDREDRILHGRVDVRWAVSEVEAV